MTLNKSAAATAMVVALGISSPVSSTEISITTDCYRPSQGYGTCDIAFTELTGETVFDIAWQDGETNRVRLLDTDDSLEIWDPQNNQWIPASEEGLCWDSKCVNYPLDFWPIDTEQVSVNCLHPTLGEGVCQMEWVSETDGLRVYWPDNSIDHVLMLAGSSEGESTLVWSYRENDWVDANNVGACLNGMCVFLDADFFGDYES